MVCGLTGAPVLVAVASLSIGHVLGYAILYGLCVRAAKASDDQHRRGREEPC